MKQLHITPRISALLKQSMGNDADISNVSVFESISANTLPLTKPGSIFNKSRISGGLLHEVEDLFASGKTVPLILLHDSTELPVGKVFHGQVRSNEAGREELRTLFFVDGSEKELISKLDTGTIDEVSIGVKSKKLTCSQCEFDFFGPKATFMNLMDRTCDEGHVVGEDGCFLNLQGLDVLLELSLVGIGAADNPKIVGPSKSVLSPDVRERLVAQGYEPSATILFASATLEKKMNKENDVKGDNSTDLTTLVDNLVKAKMSTVTAENELEELKATLIKKDAEISTLNSSVSELKSIDMDKINAEFKACKTDLKLAVDCISAITKRVLVAGGVKDPKVPNDVTGLVAALDEAQGKLASILITGGKSLAADSQKQINDNPRNIDAFRVNKTGE